MKIYGIAVVRNEQDIIEPLVRHNLKYLDGMTVMDNASVDGTKEILRQLAGEFPQLKVVHDDYFADNLSQRSSRLLWQSPDDADYLVSLDADEFLSPKSRDEFEEMCVLIPDGGFAYYPWKTLVVTPDSENICAFDPPTAIRKARVEELPKFFKVIVNMKDNYKGDLILFVGSHTITAPSGRVLPSVTLPMPLYHFPVRSREQIVGKACVNWMAWRAFNPDAKTSQANYHKREIYEAVVSGREIDVPSLSFLYAQDDRAINWDTDVEYVDTGISYARKYSDGQPMPAVQLIARSWEQWMDMK